MKIKISRQRLYAGLLFIGGGILLFRTFRLVSDGVIDILESWVIVLLFIEMVLDIGVMIFSLRWWIVNNVSIEIMPLRFAAAATILHAIRVLIFVIGRVGPWINFDVKRGQSALLHTGSGMGWVWFAAIMSLVSIVVVIVIWRYRISAKKIKLPP